MAQKPISEVFRRLKIKRMQEDGTYESEWQDVSSDVKKYGRITKSIDAQRRNKIRFNSINIAFDNSKGRYNIESESQSLWFGFASQQRTLIKIEAGFVTKRLDNTGYWNRGEVPGSYWDVSVWDDDDQWDCVPAVYHGIVNGDISVSDQNTVNLPIMPLQEIFRTFPANLLTGYTSTGLTASQFMESVRDMTNGSGSFVFRPFFGDTTTNWDIDSTSQVYSELNTQTAQDLEDKTVWDVIEKLAEAENYVSYVTGGGIFKFKDRADQTTTSDYKFVGLGFVDTEYGQTIKRIGKFGPKFTKYYSRVQVKYVATDTSTSIVTKESNFTISGNVASWSLGYRTLKIENVWIPTSTVADSLAENIFNDVSALKRELEFSASYIPYIDPLQKVRVSYDPSQALPESLWDNQNWAEDTATVALSTDLIWDASKGDAFFLNNEEMRVLSVDLDLDKLETKFILRET